MTFSDHSSEDRSSLASITAESGYADRALTIIQRVSRAADDAAAVALLAEAKGALGAEHAVFVSFIRDDESRESFRFLVACDPLWCIEYQRNSWFSQDAWLLYAATNSEPTCASHIPLRTRSQRVARALASKHGIASAYVVPAPASGGLSRLGVLILGSGSPNFFTGAGVSPLKLLARSLAMELHEWWIRQARSELIAQHRIKDEDLQLLMMERRGMGTKEITEELQVSAGSVDSRFQRLCRKFNMPNRRATARLAAEYGLI
jgi:DNA-binding CsgD family transcriptional regulator